ncbi:MAG: hypothetical protein VKJ46_12390 [Leptolyngbyaceae bacterium]|nr:hypothetical protein [Leptolyngbyaceae bacterium]
MARHTQAHMSETVDKRRSRGLSEMRKRQMEYYMGAKLIEIGVDPKSAIYRWTVETQDQKETWTYSAYWGDSRERLEQG